MQMMIEIPEEQAAALAQLSTQRNAPREILISEALKLYLRVGHTEVMPAVTPSPITDPEERRQILLSLSGSLPHLGDGMAFQERLRNEWVREWDPEYDPEIHG